MRTGPALVVLPGGERRVGVFALFSSRNIPAITALVGTLLAGVSGWAPPAQAQTGTQLWLNRFNIGNGQPAYNFARPFAIATGTNGNVFVTGYVGNSPYYVTVVAYSSAGTPLWTNYPAGPVPGATRGEPSAITTDANGNIYVTGFSYTLLTSASTFNYYTLAYNSAGAVRWSDSYNVSGIGGNTARDVALASSGNVVVTGSSSNSLSSYDYATVAYSSGGSRLWTRTYNGPNNGKDFAQAIKLAPTGTIIVTGYSDGGAATNDYATLAYSSSGQALWTNRYDGPASGDDHAMAMAVDHSGNVFVTGYSQGVGSGYDYATVAYSQGGVPLWTNRYNGPANGHDYASAIAVDSGGNVFVTGYSYGGAGSNDYATVAYTGEGVALWTNRYGGPSGSDDRAVAIVADSSGNVLVTGYSTGVGYDYATVAYSGAGVALWTNRFNGAVNNSDYATAMALDAAGNAYVTGYSWASSGGYSWYDFATIKYASSVQAYLSAQPSAGQLVLTWTNAGFGLQSAPDPTGPFTNLSIPPPYRASATAPQQFFRLSAY
jgi:hypothetical protein